MALLKENINNLIIDDLDKRNQNWTTIDDSLGLKADKTYVDGKVQTDVPSNAKFTDTVYSHPDSHPASMITESSTKRFVSDSERGQWNDKTKTITSATEPTLNVGDQWHKEI